MMTLIELQDRLDALILLAEHSVDVTGTHPKEYDEFLNNLLAAQYDLNKFTSRR